MVLSGRPTILVIGRATPGRLETVREEEDEEVEGVLDVLDRALKGHWQHGVML